MKRVQQKLPRLSCKEGRGQGAGRYARLQAAEGMKDKIYYFRLLNVLVAAECRVLLPPPDPLPPL